MNEAAAGSGEKMRVAMMTFTGFPHFRCGSDLREKENAVQVLISKNVRRVRV
jgi:hypothetical protein